MKVCEICNQKVSFWQDFVRDDRTDQKHHLKCVLWNNRHNVEETKRITHCHTMLEDGTFCKEVPTHAFLIIPLCKNHFEERIEDYQGSDDQKARLRSLGDEISR